MKVAIIGANGWVGRAMQSVFPEAVKYDVAKPEWQTMDDVNKCDVAFVCVPTNLVKKTVEEDGRMVTRTSGYTSDYLDTSIVEQVVTDCKCPLIIIRSTVMPGTCDKLEKLGKNIVFQPEYLGESVAHPLFDENKRRFLILGGRLENRRKAIELYQKVYNANITIRQVINYEAEVIKLSENRAIMFKVCQAQELYDACQAAGIDYYVIREAVFGDDPRFDLWWSFVYTKARGANSKCVPKDVYGWAAWAESVGFNPEFTNQLLKYNDKLIRGNESRK